MLFALVMITALLGVFHTQITQPLLTTLLKVADWALYELCRVVCKSFGIDIDKKE